ncbi:MAG: 50S ribosomal protein L32 [Candidatus Aenigmatarchaeota archaeon]
MALPKRKHSRARTRKKRTHKKISLPNLVPCQHCRKLKISHMVCPYCGYYGGREVVEVEFKSKGKK